MIRWGVISTAKIGREQVIPAIQASSNGHVVAIASRDADKGKAVAESLDIEKHYGAYEALLVDPDIDAIYNPLPNDGHAPWTIKALQAGKHVLCEKPFAMNTQEVHAVLAASRTAGKHVMEAFMWRYHPQHDRARALLDSGAVGVPNTIVVEFSYAMAWDVTTNVRLNPALGGGGLMDIGCYCINCARYISGQEPLRVSGFQTVGQQSGVDENFVGIMQFPSGLLAHFDCGIRGSWRNRYTVIGDKGRLTVQMAFRPDDQPGVIDVVHGSGKNESVEQIIVPAVNQYKLMVEDFAGAILAGRSPRFSPEDGLANMRVLDALAQSAQEGRSINL